MTKVVVIIPFRGDPALLAWTLDGYAQQVVEGIEVEVRVGGDGCARYAVGAIDMAIAGSPSFVQVGGCLGWGHLLSRSSQG